MELASIVKDRCFFVIRKPSVRSGVRLAFAMKKIKRPPCKNKKSGLPKHKNNRRNFNKYITYA